MAFPVETNSFCFWLVSVSNQTLEAKITMLRQQYYVSMVNDRHRKTSNGRILQNFVELLLYTKSQCLEDKRCYYDNCFSHDHRFILIKCYFLLLSTHCHCHCYQIIVSANASNKNLKFETKESFNEFPKLFQFINIGILRQMKALKLFALHQLD